MVLNIRTDLKLVLPFSFLALALEKCVPVRCPELTNPASGRARYSDGGGRRVRSRVTFTCDAGFVLAGAAELTCLVDGHWSHDGAVPLCRAPSCADPEPVENADITVRGNKVQYLVSNFSIGSVPNSPR